MMDVLAKEQPRIVVIGAGYAGAESVLRARESGFMDFNIDEKI